MSKGKNFSCNNVEQKRKKSDFYETPYSITQHLLDVEDFRSEGGVVLEPACGDGAIVRVLNKGNYGTCSYDKEQDFLRETFQFTYLITNPPYSLAMEFILKAKQVATKKFAMLLPLSYLHGKARYDNIFTDKEFPLKTIYVFTRYPMLGDELREDGKYRTGMMVYAWFVWDKNHKGDACIKWIDNNEDVLSRKDK